MNSGVSKDRRIGVIGGGLAGLAAACTLAARGYPVTIFEKNQWMGGKAAELRQNGFRFDMGPTILTLPRVLDRIFDEAKRSPKDYLSLVRLDPQWRCFFDDQNVLDLVSDTAAMKSRIEQLTDGNTQDAAGYERFLSISEKLHDVSNKFFFWKSVGGIGDTLEVGGAFSPAVLKDVISLRMGKTVAGLVRSCVTDSRLAQMIDHFTQYVGSSPEASPAVLCGIAHMQTKEGVWYPMGGTRTIPDALAKLANELGVVVRTESDVEQIVIESRRVKGIRLVDGQFIALDAVISNCDSVRTHRELIKDSKVRQRFEKRRKYEPACSGVVLYLGLRQRYEHLLTTISFSRKTPRKSSIGSIAEANPLRIHRLMFALRR